jgi:uncharacterized protein (DUF1786 family)
MDSPEAPNAALSHKSMKILTVDIGTGTQDIFLYDSRLSLENGFKLVLPSPTMMIHRRIKRATSRQAAILLTGRQMGGGPSTWAAQAHARAGFSVFATPDAARTLDDDLARVSNMGVQIVSEDEARQLGSEIEHINLGDFYVPAIAATFAAFGVDLDDLDAAVVGVFDHGAAPPGYSDRQFRFDYLDQRIRDHNSLAAFAFLPGDVPPIMTRLRSVAQCSDGLDCPLVVMDTAPAAVLGATFDPQVVKLPRCLVVNVGNFHTLAFRLAERSIEGLFEHHTGELDLHKLESFLIALADGSLTHGDVFDDMGHGALVSSSEPLILGQGEFDIIVTGPRRALFKPHPDSRALARDSGTPQLRPYFAVPFGDMMLSGCFGLLAATAEVLPDLADVIHHSMQSETGMDAAPWDLE